MAEKYSTFRISKEISDILEKLKEKTGCTKTYLVKKAVLEYYKDIIDKEEK